MSAACEDCRHLEHRLRACLRRLAAIEKHFPEAVDGVTRMVVEDAERTLEAREGAA